jgi:hypothetical protein
MASKIATGAVSQAAGQSADRLTCNLFVIGGAASRKEISAVLHIERATFTVPSGDTQLDQKVFAMLNARQQWRAWLSAS